jgi:hypothetical protein
MVGFFLLDHAPLIIIALVALVWQWRQGRRFWPLYIFFATLACASNVKDGAVDYYFNEVAYLLAAQVGIALALWFKVQSSRFKVQGSKFNTPTGVSVQSSRFSSLIIVLLGLQVVIAAGMFVAWNQWRDNEKKGQKNHQAQG